MCLHILNICIYNDQGRISLKFWKVVYLFIFSLCSDMLHIIESNLKDIDKNRFFISISIYFSKLTFIYEWSDNFYQ